MTVASIATMAIIRKYTDLLALMTVAPMVVAIGTIIVFIVAIVNIVTISTIVTIGTLSGTIDCIETIVAIGIFVAIGTPNDPFNLSGDREKGIAIEWFQGIHYK